MMDYRQLAFYQKSQQVVSGKSIRETLIPYTPFPFSEEDCE